MPWHIAQGVEGCAGWAVVKDSTGEIEGCHDTRREALRQLAALHIAEPDARADQQQENSMNEQTEQRGIDESAYAFSPRQVLQYTLAEAIVEQHGRYNQGIDSEGAHYVAESPFAGEGMVCSSCVFYEGPRACELVEGDIDPNGICKLWIIPNTLLQIAPPAEVAMDEDEDEMEEEQPMEETPRTVPLAIYTRKAQMRDRTYVAPAPVAGPATYSALEIEDRKVNGRTLEMRRLELRLAGNVDQPMRFRGYAAVFNSPSQPLPFIETIRPGAFRRSLMSGKEIRMYLNHNSDQVLASTKSGTLMLREDARGLYVEAELPDTTYGRDLSVLMQRGDVHSMSFGFTIPKNGDSWSGDGTSRELREVILHEVSVVTGFPAYEGTAGATVDVA